MRDRRQFCSWMLLMRLLVAMIGIGAGRLYAQDTFEEDPAAEEALEELLTDGAAPPEQTGAEDASKRAEGEASGQDEFDLMPTDSLEEGLSESNVSSAETESVKEQPGEQQPGYLRGKTEEYLIRPGDTLWDISRVFFNDSYRWPNLWQLNDYITNPHWIYPGSRLRFFEGSAIRPPRADIVRPKRKKPPQPVAQATSGKKPSILVTGERENRRTLREDGFVSGSRIKGIGSVYRSAAESEQLSEGDIVYLKFRTLRDVKPGNRYTIIRHIKKISGVGRNIGHLHRTLGSVEITDVSQSVATGIIRDSYDTIFREKDVLVPYINPLRQVILTPNDRQLLARVVSAVREDETIEFGIGDVVFVDRGENDGVRPGNAFDIVRRGDGLVETQRALLQVPEPVGRLPWKVIGRVIVVSTKEAHSTGVIDVARDGIVVKDRVLMRQGRTAQQELETGEIEIEDDIDEMLNE